MNNDLQKEDFILPGGIGMVRDLCGKLRDITKLRRQKNGSVTLTISPPKDTEHPTEDADFEILPQNKIENNEHA